MEETSRGEAITDIAKTTERNPHDRTVIVRTATITSTLLNMFTLNNEVKIDFMSELLWLPILLVVS